VTRLVAGVDLGETNTVVAAVAADGAVHARAFARTPVAAGPDAVLHTVTTLLTQLAVPVEAVGVGSPGVIDATAGVVVSATGALTGWSGLALTERLGAAVGVPVIADSNVHAHALGEAWLGAATGPGAVLSVAVGTGVGASLLIDGRVHHGAHFTAGQAGHVPVPAAAGRPCDCGRAGHAVAAASAPAMIRRYREHGQATDLMAIAARAAPGDRAAGAVLAEGATVLGQLISVMIKAFDPHAVLIDDRGGPAGLIRAVGSGAGGCR
jgi:glucokinase